MKQIVLFFIILISISSFREICSITDTSTADRVKKISKSSKTKIKSKSKTEESSQPDTSDAPLWQGWIKYFNYSKDTKIAKPTEFFVNNAFYKQKVLKTDIQNQDDTDYLNIRSKFYFYAKLNKDSLNIVSERNDLYSKTVDTLNIDMIQPIDETNPLSGPVQDVGKFPEGNCVSVSTIVPKTYDKDFLPIKSDDTTQIVNWIICTDDKDQKDKLYSFLITYRLIKQKKEHIVVSSGKKDENQQSQSIEHYNGSDANPDLDGYLVLIQDWTQCTLKCGGGESYQQWSCVPPKAGGHACVGKLVRKKKCNTKKCPSQEEETKSNDQTSITFKPIFKTMPINPRPQQNVPCVLRENDVLYEQLDEASGYTVKIPGRILMNNRTISLFKDENFDHSVFTYSLNSTEFNPYQDDFCCFYLSSQNQRHKMCGMGGDCGTSDDPKFLKSWEYSFSLFKNKCFNSFTSAKAGSDQNSSDSNENDVLNDMNMDEDEVQDRQKILEEKLAQSSSNNFAVKITNTQKTALKAITKELNIESRIKKEEMLKAKEEAKLLAEEIKKESKKQEKLEEALENKETQGNQLMEKRNVNNTINSVTQEANVVINNHREELKAKIMAIRQRAERRKKMIRQKINVIRNKIANDIMSASKSGSFDTCKNTMQSPDLITAYCNTYIVVDYLKYKTCNDPDKFCYACCENEFGVVQLEKREQCLNMCDQLNATKTPINASWIWNDKTQSLNSTSTS